MQQLRPNGVLCASTYLRTAMPPAWFSEPRLAYGCQGSSLEKLTRWDILETMSPNFRGSSRGEVVRANNPLLMDPSPDGVRETERGISFVCGLAFWS